MNVLWLDDSNDRTKLFRSHAPYAVLTETAAECIAKMIAADEPWDVVFLDHDLGGETYVDPSLPNTGSAVVRWICENKPKIKRVIVHSCNTVAAQYMTEDLIKLGYDADRIPITNLIYDNLLETILQV